MPKTEQISSIQARVPSGPIGKGAPINLHLRRRIKVVAVLLKNGLTPQTYTLFPNIGKSVYLCAGSQPETLID